MEINSDYKNLLKSLNAADARYLVIGGYAVMAYTEPRYTKDLDIWVDPEAANAIAVFGALAEFGAPLRGITASDFAQPEIFYQVGVAPVRVDILTSIADIDFAAAWERRITANFDGESCPVIGREDLIAAKRAAGRSTDEIDVANLLLSKKLEDAP